MSNEIGKRIRQRREELGLSMESLAAKVCVSWTSVQQWENGTSSPRRSRTKALAEALEVSEDWLNTGALRVEFLAKADQELLELIGYLTDEQKNILKMRLMEQKAENESMFRSLSKLKNHLA